jgi:hypothetical protein
MTALSITTIDAATRRKLLIFVALIMSLWASWYVSQEPETDASLLTERSPRSAALAKRSQAKPEGVALPDRLEWPQPAEQNSTVIDLFSPPAPAQPKAVLTPFNPPPVAPPLQYKYIGRLEGSYNASIFLSDDAQRVITAVAGQNLNDGWKLLSVDSQKLVFLHSATGAENTMIIGTMP